VSADRVRGLDPKNAGHIAVHQNISKQLVLDVDDSGHGVDTCLQQPPPSAIASSAFLT